MAQVTIEISGEQLKALDERVATLRGSRESVALAAVVEVLTKKTAKAEAKAQPAAEAAK